MSKETDILKLLHFDETYLTPVRRRLREARTLGDHPKPAIRDHLKTGQR